MSKTERQETVETLIAQLKDSPNVYVTDFTGLNVLRMTELRRRLRQAGVEYLVVKNTLAQRAWPRTAISALDEHLAGPTGLVLSGKDALTAAKILARLRQGVREAGDQGRAGGWQARDAGAGQAAGRAPVEGSVAAQLAGTSRPRWLSSRAHERTAVCIWSAPSRRFATQRGAAS